MKTIKLRALEPSDLEFLYQVENDANNWLVSQTNQLFSYYTLEEYISQAHLDLYTAKQQRWVICEKKTNERLGFIDLFDFDARNRRVGVGILIAEEQNRGKGYASQALAKIIEYCFSYQNLHQIYANIITDNDASISLFSKFGFQKTGVKKDWIQVGNIYKDEAFFQLINMPPTPPKGKLISFEDYFIFSNKKDS